MGLEIVFRDVLADVPLAALAVVEFESLGVNVVGVLAGVGQLVVAGPDGRVLVGEGD